ncbi:c-type cytochrome [Rufibacter quisquiliarum]|uniref:Mono/diheme cytochrome c family protein n=1 Tax=Rufibacter quisquiliarum TaxID=1549639 RepID=A0A839GG99_9BACT|nr:cytochrome c [Rufibacter quisquiliarum]MBA9075679.1 mono/diheme cytochrome c family protein [Rufibacter quisquiliarum]
MKKASTTVKTLLQRTAVAIIGSMLLFNCSSGGSEGYADQYKQEQANQAAAQEAPAEEDGKGVGPVKTVDLGADIDQALAENGKSIFDGKCSACHQLSDQKVVGPGLAGVTDRRKPEWVMNMIINPEEMTKKDATAKKLLAEHLTQMTNQNVNEQDARAILEFLRQNDKAI